MADAAAFTYCQRQTPTEWSPLASGSNVVVTTKPKKKRSTDPRSPSSLPYRLSRREGFPATGDELWMGFHPDASDSEPEFGEHLAWQSNFSAPRLDAPDNASPRTRALYVDFCEAFFDEPARRGMRGYYFALRWAESLYSQVLAKMHHDLGRNDSLKVSQLAREAMDLVGNEVLFDFVAPHAPHKISRDRVSLALDVLSYRSRKAHMYRMCEYWTQEFAIHHDQPRMSTPEGARTLERDGVDLPIETACYIDTLTGFDRRFAELDPSRVTALLTRLGESGRAGKARGRRSISARGVLIKLFVASGAFGFPMRALTTHAKSEVQKAERQVKAALKAALGGEKK